MIVLSENARDQEGTNVVLPAADPNPNGQISTSHATAHALGGLGGRAINLTYVDNYSTLMLVYTFLNTLAKGNSGLDEAAKALTPLLQSAMAEERQYREAFLEAVKSLKQ